MSEKKTAAKAAEKPAAPKATREVVKYTSRPDVATVDGKPVETTKEQP